MALTLNKTDPLSTLLTKYVPDPTQRPTRDLTGSWRDKDFHSLVVGLQILLVIPVLILCAQMTNSWRALAQMACDRIVNSPPTDLEHILEVLYLLNP